MNKKRYGGFIIHFGTVLVFVGITASSAFNTEKLATVKDGESFTAGAYTLQFEKISERRDPEKTVVMAPLNVTRDGVEIGRLVPEKHFHHKSEQPQSEVVIRSSFKEDLYVVLSAWDENGVTFHVFINPLVIWIWIGVAIMVLGGVFVLIPDRKRPIAVVAKTPEEEVRNRAA